MTYPSIGMFDHFATLCIKELNNFKQNANVQTFFFVEQKTK